MLLDSRLVPQTIISPNSFVGLMSVYESNYLRLLQLIPDLEQLDGCHHSRVAGQCDLYVDILERCRYTVTLGLTYRFESEQGVVTDPDIKVRAYLDGKLAEAMSIGDEDHRHAELRRLLSAHREELDVRWHRNIVLNKWLDYLSEQGHLILQK